MKARLEGPLHESERVLEDDYPVYVGYYYVADGRVIMSPIQGNVKSLKWYLKAQEIRSCAAVERDLPL